MAGKRSINNSGRTVIPTAKTIKIVTRNNSIPDNFEDALGSKHKLQLRNRCINLKNIQVIKHRRSRSHRLDNISRSSPENLKSVSTKNACDKIFVNQETLETPTRSNYILSLENHQEDDLDYEPDFENHSNTRFSSNSTIRNESPTVPQNLEYQIRNEFNNENTHYDSTTEDNNSVSHRSDMLPRMLPYIRQDDEDGQNDFIRYTPSHCSQILDTSSSSSNKSSHKDDNIEDDANSYVSDYDISDEVENRLLESDENDDELSPTENEHSQTLSEEEEQGQIQEEADLDFEENHPVFQDSQVRKIGKTIFITAFNTNTDTDTKVCIKRPNNTNLKVNVKRPNRHKWNCPYHPYKNVTLHLDDIGYIAPPLRSKLSESSSENSEGSGSESAAPTNFKVTIGSTYNRKCEKVQPPFIENGFKVPLPPIKRPPSRPKRPGSSTGSSNMSPSSSVTDLSETYIRETFLRDNMAIERPPQKEDDAISIVASSIGRFEMEEAQSLLDHDFDVDNVDNVDRSYVADWISSQIPIIPSSTSTNSVSSVQILEKKPLIIGSNLNFKNVNPFFSGLCYHYYFNENCSRIKCKIAHNVNISAYTRRCWELPKDEMESIYNSTLHFHLLFSHMYPVFINGFAYHRMQNKLLTCIDDFFDLRRVVDPRSAIEKVVAALVQTGLTFSEAIEKISFNVGLLRHPELADILLDLITQKPNLAENWEEIKRICRAKNYMPPKILERIISKILLKPMNINKDMCKDLYNVIIKNEMTDLSQVNAELLSPLKTLAQFGSNTNYKNNSLNNVIENNLVNERQRFELEDSKNEPQTHVINNDSDERQFQYVQKITTPPPTTRTIPPAFASPHSSSRSSTNSEKFNVEENRRDLVSPSRDSNYHYVPQSLAAFPHTSEEPSLEPNFIVNIPPPTFNRPPPTLNISLPNLTSTPPNLISTPPSTLTWTPPSTLVNTPPILIGPPPLMSLKFDNQISKSIKSPPLEINLCPEMPIFGKFRYKKGFVFDECLHNLLASSREQVPLNENDIIKLNDIIKTGNGAGFLQILEQYKGPNTLQNFITMSLAHLKNCDDRPYNSLTDLIENIDILKPDFKRDPFLKGVFEVIIFNLLFFLERKCQWNDGRKLIELFCDWDSLISSKLLQQLSIRKFTPMGRYIFLAKFLTQAKAFYKVYDILHSTDLNLLESPEKWRLFHSPTVDLENRNALLTDFFKYAYLNNIEVVCDIYRNIFQFGDIWEFDALSYFNPMLETLINTEKTSSLKHFYSNIEIFYKKMNRNILRAFIIYLDTHINVENKFKLYLMGVQKGIYVDYTGKEPWILVRTNMPDVELKLILEYYIHKLDLLPKELSNHDLRIEIKLPNEMATSPNILQRCVRSVAEVNNSVKKILYQCFGIFLREPDQKQNSNSTVIQIPKEELNSESRNACR